MNINLPLVPFALCPIFIIFLAELVDLFEKVSDFHMLATDNPYGKI